MAAERHDGRVKRASTTTADKTRPRYAYIVHSAPLFCIMHSAQHISLLVRNSRFPHGEHTRAPKSFEKYSIIFNVHRTRACLIKHLKTPSTLTGIDPISLLFNACKSLRVCCWLLCFDCSEGAAGPHSVGFKIQST